MYLVSLMSVVFFVAVYGVASSPSPCYGTLLLVVSSGVGCGVVAQVGESFPALVLFLIYLGGMLVVFAYSVSMSSDVFPNVWNFRLSGVFIFCGVFLFFVFGMYYFVGFPVGRDGYDSWFMLGSEYSGVSLLYSCGGGFLLVVGFGLLLTLYVVFEMVRWVSFGCFKIA